MDDSLEEYIKLVRQTKEDSNIQSNEELRQKQLVTLQKKTECELRARKMVEFLIEGKLQPEVFLRCLKHINQSYYQDIVDERAIDKVCGYPLCGNQLPEMPKKQYFIDTKNNKVYDVTNRKNYCSNFCYAASIHIKQQIDDSPLWLRNMADVFKFNLLTETERGIPGEEINQEPTMPIQSADFTSVSSFAEVSLNEITEMEVGGKRNAHRTKTRCGRKQQFLETVNECNEVSETVATGNYSNVPYNISEDKATTSDAKCTNTSASTSHCSANQVLGRSNNLVHEVMPRKKIPPDSTIKQSKCKTKKENSKDILENIKKSVLEWITLDTYIFLYGNTRVKEFLSEKQLEEYFDTLQLAESTTLQKRKYMEICRQLCLNQFAEDKYDKIVTGRKSKPVPNFKTLKEESKAMDLKVHSFYSGMPYELEQKKIEGNTNENKNELKEAEDRAENQTSEGPPAVLPLVDINSQTAIRRRIYLNSVNKAMVILIQNLGITSQYILQDLQLLVKTFKLHAHSVVFMPSVWNLIALILIKMLSIRDSNLKMHLETKRSETFINLVLNRFPNAQILLCELFENINDIDLFLKQHFSEIS